MSRPITRFDGPRHRFLSNFHPAPVALDGHPAPTVEHAYQAAKAVRPEDRLAILQAPTPAQAKRLGRRVEARPDWEAVKLQVMEDLLRQKFAPGSSLAALLLATGDAELVEGNAWGDRFWGVCRGEGENHLGRLLMKIRDDLRQA